MKNAFEEYRQKHKLSYAELGRLVGKDRATVMRHCKAKTVPESAAARYHAILQIPLETLQPGLYRVDSSS